MPVCAGEKDYLPERRRVLRRSGKRISLVVPHISSAGAGAGRCRCHTQRACAANAVAGRVLGSGDGVYTVMAVFWPKDFQAFTTQRAGLSIAMDYMDYLVLYLDTCATTGGDRALIAGAAFADLGAAEGGPPASVLRRRRRRSTRGSTGMSLR